MHKTSTIHPLSHTLLLAAVSVSIAACVQQEDDTTGDALVVDDASFGQSVADPAAPTMDDLRARVGDVIPEFAGIYVEGDTLVALTTAEVDQARLWGALESSLALPDDGRKRLVRAHARYPFSRLKRWHDAVTLSLLADDEIHATDIDERANRLVVDVAGPEGRAAAQRILAAAGVPVEAVDLVVRDATQEHGLRDKTRPLVGGLQISVPGGLCTLGFPAKIDGVAGFVTCSHCTSLQGLKDDSAFGQPNQQNGIGVEFKDPFYWAGGDCTADNGCRNSDSAFAKSAVESKDQVAFAKTNAFDINGLGRITQKDMWPLQGSPARKVGRTTGGTQGTINGACINIKSTSQFMYVCNHRVTADSTLSQPGDSGSPVFWPTNNPLPNDVRLMGLLWGGSTNSFVFSPLGGVEKDLGTLDVCAPGFSC